ncbi:MAG TPA: AMP-binding protein, partial [Burkholderiales bacterium]|nr:AMP-binding protein [Burkholderiales bacterium]
MLSYPEARGHAGNLGLLLSAHAHEAKPAIVDLTRADAPRPVSYRELDAACNAVARGLARAGIERGDRVGILSLNRWEFVAVILGAMRAGVVPVPINVKLAAETVAYITADSGAKLVFTEAPLRGLVPAGCRIVEFGSGGADGFDAF